MCSPLLKFNVFCFFVNIGYDKLSRSLQFFFLLNFLDALAQMVCVCV